MAFYDVHLKCGLVLRAGIEPARLAAADFKSAVSTNFTTGAAQRNIMTQAGRSCHTDNTVPRHLPTPHLPHHLRRIMDQLADVLAAPPLQPQHDGAQPPPGG